MNTPAVPNDQSTKGFSIPRWLVPIYWAVGFLLVHNLFPWGLSFLSARYGWVGRRPGLENLFSLILLGAALLGVAWTMALHFVHCSQRVAWVRTPNYLLIDGPYKFTRNPMYLAELALWLSWALLKKIMQHSRRTFCISGGQGRDEEMPTNGRCQKPEKCYFGARIPTVRCTLC